MILLISSSVCTCMYSCVQSCSKRVCPPPLVFGSWLMIHAGAGRGRKGKEEHVDTLFVTIGDDEWDAANQK